MPQQTVWGMHAGATGDADTLFSQHQMVAIGWPEMEDLSGLESREDFKARYDQAYPGKSVGHVAVSAGQLYRFVREVKIGDLVVYPSQVTRQVNLGTITGEYKFRPDVDEAYPHQRSVKWLKSVPRTNFSQGALYEIGSAMSLFQVKNYATEFRDAATGEAKAPPVESDESVAVVTAEIEEQTRDFVLKRLSQSLKGLPLETFVAHLLERMGYRARLTPPNEPSIDIIAHKDVLGLEPPIIKVQVKSGDGKVSDRDVSALYGKVSHGEFGLLVTLGGFTPPALQFAASKGNLRLIDGRELVDLVFDHYEQFDARFKGILPLKKVYVPEVLQQEP